jgi:CubicO group peptidase (beta-lactamase class C family)
MFDPSLVEEEFYRNFTDRQEAGAALCVLRRGEVLIDLHAGTRDSSGDQPWTQDTAVLIWSCTKALAATCLLLALEEHGIDPGSAVARHWPQFGQAGKENVTFAQLLSHQAGLAAIEDDPASAGKLQWDDHSAVAAALAAQPPNWQPGEGHGYHGKTYGYLIDEALRRVAGQDLSSFWRETIAEPLALDIWIGMPDSEQQRLAQIIPPKVQPGSVPHREEAFYAALADKSTLTHKAFTRPTMPPPGRMNEARNRKVANGSLGGYATAPALARFYVELMAGEILSESTLDLLKRPRTSGEDRVLRIATAFAPGFMKDPLNTGGRKSRGIFGPSLSAYGQPGAGGSLAFADPENEIAFAYVMNRMELGVLPNDRALSLVEALYQGQS